MATNYLTTVNLLPVLITLIASLLQFCSSQRGRIYPVTLQPELDSLDIGIYFRNSRLLNLQLMCIFYEGPCDIAGRWLKPRMIAGLLGECPVCTPYQKQMLPQWLWTFASRYPLQFRAVVAQWLMDQGFKVPFKEVPKIQQAMGFREMERIVNPKNVIKTSYDNIIAKKTKLLKIQPVSVSDISVK